MKKYWKHWGIAVPLASIVLWFVLGVATLRAQTTDTLIYCVLYPHRFPEVTSTAWEFFPSKLVERLALIELRQRSLDEIDRDLKRWGMTVYRLTFGHVDVNETDAHKLEQGPDAVLASEIAKLLYLKGLRASVPIAPHGCSAVHDALIDRNISTAKYFLKLEGKTDVAANPEAQIKKCRLSAEGLAQTYGFTLR